MGDGALLILRLHLDHSLFGVLHKAGLLTGHDHVIDADGDAGAGGVKEPEFLHLIEHCHRYRQAVLQVAVLHELRQALLLEQAVDERHLVRKHVVENDTADGRIHVLFVELDRLGVHQVLVVEGLDQIDDLSRIAQLDRRQCFDFVHFQRDQHVVDGSERASLALGAGPGFRKVIEAQDHVLRGNGDRRAVRRRKDVIRREHKSGGFDLGFRRQRNVNSHLVAVEIGVERGTDQRMNLDGLAFHQYRLERLDAQAVQCGSAVEENRVVLDDFFQDVPYHRVLLLDQFLRLLDRRTVAALLEAVIDERLEELQRHLLRQTALVQLQLRSDHDHRAPGIVHALAQQVLAEPSLFALQRIGQRLQRTVVGAAQHAAAAAVIKQRVDGLLQHSLLVAHDHVRSVQFDQLLQPVIAVDHAAIEIVQVARGEPAAIERNQRAQFWRNDRDDVQNHPLRLVTGFPEAFRHTQTLGVLHLLLLRHLGLHPFADLKAQRFDVDLLQQFLDSLGAHHRYELAGEFLVELPLALVADDFALLEIRDLAGIHHNERFKIEHALQFAQRDIEEVTDAARQALEEPHVRAGTGEFDMSQTLSAYARQRHFDAALVADNAAVLHALVLTAQAFPVGYRSEDAGAE